MHTRQGVKVGWQGPGRKAGWIWVVLRPNLHITELLIEHGNGLLEHTPVGGRRGAAEVVPGASQCQFQRAPALLDDTVFRRHRRARALSVSSRFFLLGFYRLRFKTSSHALIVRWPDAFAE